MESTKRINTDYRLIFLNPCGAACMTAYTAATQMYRPHASQTDKYFSLEQFTMNGTVHFWNISNNCTA